MSSASASERPLPLTTSRVLDLAWPILVSMGSYTAMGIVDTVLVAGLGTTALAAAGLAMTACFLAVSFGHGLLGGVKVVAAQRTGAGDHAAADRLLWQAMWLAGLLALPVVLLASVAPSLLGLLGASEAVREAGGPFLVVRLLGAPALFVMLGLTSWLQGQGDTRTPMVANLWANGVNVALDLVLIYGLGPVPAFGVLGAALATVAAWGTGALWLLLRARRALARTSPRPDRGLLRATWRVGSPLGLQYLLDVGSFTVFAALLAGVGDAHLAAHLVAVRIISVSFLPGHALGQAAGVLVGQAVGARDLPRARAAWWEATRLALLVMVGWALVFVLAPGPLVALFRPEPDVAALVGQLLLVAAAFQLFDAFATVAHGALTGAGDTRFAMVSGTLAAWLVKLPLALGLAVWLQLGATGAWMALAAEIAVLAAIGLWRVRSGRWLRSAPL